MNYDRSPSVEVEDSMEPTAQDVEELAKLYGSEVEAVFEHDRWFLVDGASSRSWSVVACSSIGGKDYITGDEH